MSSRYDCRLVKVAATVLWSASSVPYRTTFYPRVYLENPRVQEAIIPRCSASPDIDLSGVSLAAGEDRENGFGMRSGVVSSVSATLVRESGA